MPTDVLAAGDIVDRRRRHRDRRRGADKDVGDAGTEDDPLRLQRGGGEHGELVAAMPLGDPRGSVAKLVGEPRSGDAISAGDGPPGEAADA